MKVVKRGDKHERAWPREFTCPECESVLKLELDDVGRSTDYTGCFSSWFVDCPVCSEQPDAPRDWWSTVARLKRNAATNRRGGGWRSG